MLLNSELQENTPSLVWNYCWYFELLHTKGLIIFYIALLYKIVNFFLTWINGILIFHIIIIIYP